MKTIKTKLRTFLQNMFVRVFRWYWRHKLLPISTDFGWSRGTPVGRHYVNKFVAEMATGLGGTVLEFGESRYKACFKTVQQYQVIDVVPGPSVDYVCDIHDVSSVPEHYFDVIVCTQVLEHVERPVDALRQLHKLLKHDGHLICTVPFLAHIHYVPTDFYRFSIDAICSALGTAGFQVLEARNSGNALVTLGSLLGYAAEDFRSKEMEVVDNVYPFNVLAFARPMKGGI
jgi:SAM-dependent methyltransferase